MTGNHEQGRGSAGMHRLYPWLALPVILAVLVMVALLPMTWQQQAFFGALMVVAALVIDRKKRGDLATMVMVLLCLSATTRYAYWRSATLWNYLHSPWAHVNVTAAVLMLIVLGAEYYTFLILVLGFFQTVAPLKRPPLLMPENFETWPTVDVLIPTVNESLEVVRYTVLAAQQMDWPADKVNIVLLDDGGRGSFRAFAAEAGVQYIARKEHAGAKAGNLNHALRQLNGEFIAIFDCDHMPTRSFLQISLGWFLQDSQLGMLQTPHHFYSPDPFERNLGKFRKVPNEGSLFYGIVQDANDLWNAAFFCGSCAVLRRSALDGIGGVAQETVTEDAHTSMRLQKAGWNTAYINLPQAAGLATETLARHIKQRIRWSRGMIQILRTDNPLFARGMKLAQRLCYFNATLHFLYALPRLIFLTAPLLFLYFGLSNVPGYWLAILAFAMPHLALTTITNSRIQGSKRFSFWNEIYETVLSPYILLPTFLALINPKSGKFNVTDKGGAQESGYFSRRLAVPYLVLLGMNLAGLALAIPRYFYWDRGHTGAIAMNVFWALFNVMILGVALSVCAETRQRRHAVRIACAVPVILQVGGESLEGMTTDLSSSGLAARVGSLAWNMGETVEIAFPEEEESGERLRGTMVGQQGGLSRVQFGELTLAEQRLLTRVLYSRADRWLAWDEGYAPDHPLRSLFSVVGASASGFWKLLVLAPGNVSNAPAKPLKPVRVAVISSLVLAMLGFAYWRANAGTVRRHTGHSVTDASSTGKSLHDEANTIERSFTLGSLAGVKQTLQLDQPGSREVLRFATPQSWLIRGGKLRLQYSVPKNATQEYTYADVRLNDSVLASITPTPEEREAGQGEIVVPLPPELLLARNELVIQLAGNGNTACADPAQKKPVWFRIDPASQVVLEAQPLAVASELASLPQPFLEHLANAPVVLPFVFAHNPDNLTLLGAGVLASWFGELADDSGVRYVAQDGALPTGNAVVLLQGTERLPGLAEGEVLASVSLRANPRDPYGKLLVIHGETSGELLAVTQAIATGQLKMQGSATQLGTLAALPSRSPNDAPRWVHTGRLSLDSLIPRAEQRIYGTDPLNVYMHLAPDYSFGVQQNMYVHLAYAVDSPELARSSNVAASLNSVPVGSALVRASGETQTADLPLLDTPAAVYANTLQVQFYFVAAGADPCAPSAGRSSAQILDSSYLDLGSAVHYTELPNLLLFAKAGFPFTRMADLSQTAVLMPAPAAADVIALYLDLMGYFGAQTGYPALGVQVASPAEAAHLGKDLLVLGTYADLAGMPEITGQLPLSYAGNGFQLSLRARLGVMFGSLGSMGSIMRRNAAAYQAFDGSAQILPDGVLEGTESPFARGRSLVLIAGRDRAQLASFASALLTTMPHDGIDSTVSLWSNGNFLSYPLSTGVYGSGDLSWYRNLGYWLPRHLFVLLALLITVLGLLGWCTEQWLSSHIRARLGLESAHFNNPGVDTTPSGSVTVSV